MATKRLSVMVTIAATTLATATTNNSSDNNNNDDDKDNNSYNTRHRVNSNNSDKGDNSNNNSFLTTKIEWGKGNKYFLIRAKILWSPFSFFYFCFNR